MQGLRVLKTALLPKWLDICCFGWTLEHELRRRSLIEHLRVPNIEGLSVLVSAHVPSLVLETHLYFEAALWTKVCNLRQLNNVVVNWLNRIRPFLIIEAAAAFIIPETLILWQI